MITITLIDLLHFIGSYHMLIITHAQAVGRVARCDLSIYLVFFLPIVISSSFPPQEPQRLPHGQSLSSLFPVIDKVLSLALTEYQLG